MFGAAASRNNTPGRCTRAALQYPFCGGRLEAVGPKMEPRKNSEPAGLQDISKASQFMV